MEFEPGYSLGDRVVGNPAPTADGGYVEAGEQVLARLCGWEEIVTFRGWACDCEEEDCDHEGMPVVTDSQGILEILGAADELLGPMVAEVPRA